MAAVEVKRLYAAPGDCLFADYTLSDGRLFDDAQSALHYALDVAYGRLKNQ